jgi:hypothetical protein
MAGPDVQTIDDIIYALYDAISGSAGEARDWERLRSLFAPHARLAQVLTEPDGAPKVQFYGIEVFIDEAERYFRQQSFYEVEIARRAERFGNIAHVFSTYEARAAPDAPSTLGRGINSIQLCYEKGRWWVVSMAWDSEREGNPIPGGYLP